MTREILLEVTANLTRAAVMEDGRLCEFHQETAFSKPLTESIFLGRVEQVSKTLNAAFVNIGLEQNAFLPLSPERRLRGGDLLIVQGEDKKATDTKGLRITEKINLAGKWLVLIPGGNSVHISKKIKNEKTRALLMEAAANVRPEGCGLIVRTATEELSDAGLEEEAALLYDRWLSIQRKAQGMRRPGVLFERLSLEERIVRDLAGKSLARITTNDRDCCARLSDQKEEGLIPASVEISCCAEDATLLFDRYGVEKELEHALRRRVWLPCGGYLVIDRCEAMTVIDVNSGKMSLGRGIEETAFRVNMESAAEIARQIRLRDIGGIILIDFIDMREAEHRSALIDALKEALKADRARVIVEGMTRLGLVEMTRRHLGEELHKTLCCGCSVCGGAGEVPSAMDTAGKAVRRLRRMIFAGQRGPFVIKSSSSVLDAIRQIGFQPDETSVYLLALPGRRTDQYEIEQIEIGAEPPKGAALLLRRNES